MKFLISFILFSLSLNSFAAGDGPTSLIPAAVNVTILVFALIFMLRKPAQEMFSSKSSSVSEMLERASSKAKEAEMMMLAQKKKTEGAEAEVSKLEEESASLVKSFEKSYSDEVATRIIKLKEDAGQKIEAEKKEMLGELNSNLLNLVVEKAKTQIKSDKSLADNATKNIVEGL